MSPAHGSALLCLRTQLPEHARGRAGLSGSRAQGNENAQRIFSGHPGYARRYRGLCLRRGRGRRQPADPGRQPSQRAGRVRHGRHARRKHPRQPREGLHYSPGQPERVQPQRPPGGQPAAILRTHAGRPEGLPAGVAADQPDRPVARPGHLHQPRRPEAIRKRSEESQPLLSGPAQRVSDGEDRLCHHGAHPAGAYRPGRRPTRIGPRVSRHQRHRLSREQRRAGRHGSDGVAGRGIRNPAGGLAGEPARPEPPRMGRPRRHQGHPPRNAQRFPRPAQGQALLIAHRGRPG